MAAATRKPRKPAADKPKFDAFQAVTDQIIALLEQGTVPWHKPWDDAALPMSLSTKRPYRGLNILLLQMAAMEKGYRSNWWGTYEQIAALGGQVRKGEKSTMITFWKPVVVEDEETGKKKTIMFMRVFRVFNADQADGLSLPAAEPRPAVEAIAECDAAVAVYLATGPKLVIGGDRACYSPALDEVRMPEREQFHAAEEYYGTLFHELTHSTGHESRLARKDLLSFHSFGDENYSREELVAEMGSAFLSAHTGIAVKTLGNSAAYLQGWIKVLRGDKRLVATAAAQAQKAVDLILGNAREVVEEPAADERVVATA